MSLARLLCVGTPIIPAQEAVPHINTPNPTQFDRWIEAKLSGPAACNLQRRKDMNTSCGTCFSSEPDEPANVFS